MSTQRSRLRGARCIPLDGWRRPRIEHGGGMVHDTHMAADGAGLAAMIYGRSSQRRATRHTARRAEVKLA
jgi:hypothetical protein